MGSLATYWRQSRACHAAPSLTGSRANSGALVTGCCGVSSSPMSRAAAAATAAPTVRFEILQDNEPTSGDCSLSQRRYLTGETRTTDLEVRFDGRIRLQFQRAKVTSDAGLVAVSKQLFEQILERIWALAPGAG